MEEEHQLLSSQISQKLRRTNQLASLTCMLLQHLCKAFDDLLAVQLLWRKLKSEMQHYDAGQAGFTKPLHCRVESAHLRVLMALQGHADVEVAVAETKTVLGRTKQAELSFICSIKTNRQYKKIVLYSSANTIISCKTGAQKAGMVLLNHKLSDWICCIKEV